MANYRKSFNFRNGVQVDEDNFIVNPVGLVGIGTTVPTEFLDVVGNAKISGTLYATNIISGNVTNNLGNFENIVVGITSLTSGVITATTGVVTYYGDGGKLLNLPTSQWLDVDVGLGFTSIYAQGFVGIATNDPRFVFQVGGNNNIAAFTDGVGFDRRGNILVSGIVTATSFVGYGSDVTLVNASNISSGTLNNSRLPSSINVSGIVTAGNFFSGRLVGVADTANSITPTSNINVNSINSSLSNTSISTVTSLLYAQQKVGIGTTNPAVDLHLRKNGSTAIQITSDGTNSSRLIIGRSLSLTSNNAELEFGNTDTGFPDSTQTSFDIANYSTGNINNYIHLGVSGINTGNFNWIYGQSLSRLMTLTYDGRLGIGITNPSNTFHVVGTSTVTGNSFIGGNLSLVGSFTPSSITVLNTAIFNGNIGILTNNPIYPVQIGREPFRPDGGLAAYRNGDVWTAGVVTATRFAGDGSTLTNLSLSNITPGTISGGYNINITGVVTATRFSGDGSTLTNINPLNVSSGTFDGNFNINSTSGIITANKFVGDGSTLNNLNPSNISTGTIDNNISINSISGIITANRFAGNGSTLTNLTGENIQGNISIGGTTTSSGGFTSGIGTGVQIYLEGTTVRLEGNGFYVEIPLTNSL